MMIILGTPLYTWISHVHILNIKDEYITHSRAHQIDHFRVGNQSHSHILTLYLYMFRLLHIDAEL